MIDVQIPFGDIWQMEHSQKLPRHLVKVSPLRCRDSSLSLLLLSGFPRKHSTVKLWKQWRWKATAPMIEASYKMNRCHDNLTLKWFYVEYTYRYILIIHRHFFLQSIFFPSIEHDNYQWIMTGKIPANCSRQSWSHLSEAPQSFHQMSSSEPELL